MTTKEWRKTEQRNIQRVTEANKLKVHDHNITEDDCDKYSRLFKGNIILTGNIILEPRLLKIVFKGSCWLE